ncbi:NitT/TauT family transport system ATP-binding protein [Xanthobacter flavus]|nr:NitT/TauT family transport system ATP-binding protein [Xanthobacter flavus]
MTIHAVAAAAMPPVAHIAPPVLEARGLTLDYVGQAGRHRAVEDVSFTVHARERLVLLGPSGCGKSSILKALAGFLKPAAGTVSLRGKAVTGPGPDRLVVFQEFDQLLPWKSITDNVAFPLRVARKVPMKEARERARAALAKVGLARAFDAYPHTLSGGMKQRAAIARALAAEPDVLLMDEPFAAPDALTRRTLQDLLRLAEEQGFTLVFVIRHPRHRRGGAHRHAAASSGGPSRPHRRQLRHVVAGACRARLAGFRGGGAGGERPALRRWSPP